MLHIICLYGWWASWWVNRSIMLVRHIIGLLSALIWTVSRLVSWHALTVHWDLLKVAGWWGHEHLILAVRVCTWLALYHRVRHLADVIPTLNHHLFLRPQNLLQRILLLHPWLLTIVLLSRRMLWRCGIFWLEITGRDSLLLIGGGRISLRNVLCRNVTGVACLCVSNYAWIVVKSLSRWSFFWRVLRYWSLNFLIFGCNYFFILILLTVNVLFLNILVRMLCPSNTSLNAFSHLMGRLNRNCIWWLWEFFLVRIQLLDSLVNKFSILFEVEFCIVTDWRVDYLVRNNLLLWFMEWGQVRMLKNLSCWWTLLWVDWKHWCQKVQSVLRYWGFKPLVEGLLLNIDFVYHCRSCLWV